MSARLSPEEYELFLKLLHSLMFHVNQQLGIIPDVDSPDEFSDFSPEERVAVRNALVEQPELIDSFVESNPADLSDDELSTVRSWRNFVAGRFFIFRYFKNYTVFLSSDDPPIAYGVLALHDSFEDIVGPYLPVWVETVLLPFRGKIVYDGLATSYNISFGGGIKRSLNESYQESKERMGGVVTSLPAEPAPIPSDKPRKKTKRVPGKSSSAEVRPVLETIIGMTDEFCRENLNDEYAMLCRELAEKLARKRPSPLLRGQPASWASGIVRAIGWVNFLSDPSQTPHMLLKDIDEGFGISESTGAAKLKQIRTMLGICQLDPSWTLPSRIDENPLIWILEIDGLPIDARHAPREIQEIAFQKGLIPYIPADRE